MQQGQEDNLIREIPYFGSCYISIKDCIEPTMWEDWKEGENVALTS